MKPMSPFFGPGMLEWTYHARAKMRFYRLSEARVRQVLHAPKRVEDGVAPNTIALMLPTSIKNVIPGEAQRRPGTPMKPDRPWSGKREETWTQEIWVMIQEKRDPKRKTKNTKVISAWRYPGRSKPRSEALKDIMKREYSEFFSKK